MNPRAQIRMLPDGRRLHLHDGPIDLIVEAFGQACEVETAYRAAGARFVTVLDELCSELSYLRQALLSGSGVAAGRGGAQDGGGGDALRRASTSSRPWRRWRERWRKRFWRRWFRRRNFPALT